MIRIIMLSAVSLLALPISSALAKDFPNKGEADVDTYYIFDSRATMPKNDVGSAGIDEFNGVSRNVKGEDPFNDMSVYCLAHWTMISGAYKSNGSCIETDKDGDTIFVTFDEGTDHLVGGTGKYKGITGKSPYTVTELHANAGGRPTYVVNHKRVWEIK